jgi:hypothetical protein
MERLEISATFADFAGVNLHLSRRIWSHFPLAAAGNRGMSRWTWRRRAPRMMDFVE